MSARVGALPTGGGTSQLCRSLRGANPAPAAARYTVRVSALRLAPALLLAAGCASTAPYTVGAAVVNTALAAGTAAVQRAAGGCIATCTNGTVCNERTGFCERGVVAAPSADARDVCGEDPAGGTRCIPAVGARSEPPPVRLPVGVSPATGSVPPPPSESSPRSAP
jgi:hypothetical protein